jgi:fucose permease
MAVVGVLAYALGLAGSALCGLGLAPQFPTAVALYQRRDPMGAERWLGPWMPAGGIGGAIWPYVLGRAAELVGGLRGVMHGVFLLAASLAMLLPRLAVGGGVRRGQGK